MMHAQITMRSTVLEMDTKVDVLLPEDRHHTADLSKRRYPVLYVLHGAKEDNSSWINLSTIMLLCRDLDLVVVMPTTYRGSYANALYGKDYYTWISEELPVKIKNLFPVSDRREDTFIMGESMGGYGTMRIALSKPDQYGKAVVLSAGNFGPAPGGRFDKLRYGIFGDTAEWETSDNNLYNLMEKLKASPAKPAMRFYCGTEDRVFENCRETFAHLKQTNPDMDLDAEYWPGQHNFFFWNQAIPKALDFFGFEVVQNSVV